jgi:uncharacterized membrane protein YfcA
MVQALGLSFTVATLALAVRLHASAPLGEWSTPAVLAVSGALAGAFAGLRIGERLRSRLAGPAFQKALFLVFIGLGGANLLQSG